MNWPRPPTRKIFSDGPVERAALIVNPTPTANANDTPVADPTPTARRSSGYVAGLKNAGLVSCELNAEHLALFDEAMNESKQMCTQRIRRSIWTCRTPRMGQTASRQVP